MTRLPLDDNAILKYAKETAEGPVPFEKLLDLHDELYGKLNMIEEGQMKKKVRMGIYVSEEVRDLAHKLRDETGRSISHVMEASIKEWAIREWGKEVEDDGVLLEVCQTSTPVDMEDLWRKVERKIEDILQREDVLKRSAYRGG